jgi:hypothetical protein
MRTPINIIAQKEISSPRWVAAPVKEFQKVTELSVDVADHVQWRIDPKNDIVVPKNFDRLRAKVGKVVVRYRNVLRLREAPLAEKEKEDLSDSLHWSV